MTEHGPVIVETSPDRIELTLDLSGHEPADAFRDWVEPGRLTQWWPPEATVDARPGGEYELRWPGMDWRLRGRFLEFEPGRRLRFSWTWDHEPSVTKEVTVTFERLGRDSTRIRVEHRPYGPGARDRELRQEHLDGWSHFLQRLRAGSA